MKRFVLSLAVMLSTADSKAASVEFQPTLTTYICPPGAVYPLMECEPHEMKLPPQIIEMNDLGDGYFQGVWDLTTEKFPAHHTALITRYPTEAGEEKAIVTIFAGWDPQYERNGHMFMDSQIDRFPQSLLFVGDRKKVGNIELVIYSEISNLKFVK